MKGEIHRLPRAELDLQTAAEYIAQDNLDAAVRFINAAEDAFRKLAEMPGMGPTCEFDSPELSGLRSWPMGGSFRNYLVFYRQVPDGVEIVRVLHGARKIEEILEG